MIGKICVSLVPFFNIATKKHSVKGRPVLIIGDARNNDYTILPVSSVTNKQHLDAEFDVELDPVKYYKLNIAHISYVRTHKQMPIHKGSIGREITDLKSNYPDLFKFIMTKRDIWNTKITNKALE